MAEPFWQFKQFMVDRLVEPAHLYFACRDIP
jgi:hypothetical protein